tara:strand:+ start:526 stop:1041 length:516 start_codon:yes stop_codon:yes gene_type:complete
MTASQLRPTVAGFFVKPRLPYPLIGIHWPAKAAQCGESNLTTAGGGIRARRGESPEQAMRREIWEEYGLPDTAVDVTAMPHAPWAHNGKLYTWCLVVTDRDPEPEKLNAREVSSFGWWTSTDQIGVAAAAMHENKRKMFLRALGMACRMQPDLFVNYKRDLKELRKQRQYA